MAEQKSSYLKSRRDLIPWDSVVTPHVGLLLERGVKVIELKPGSVLTGQPWNESEKPNTTLIEQACKFNISSGYTEFLNQWRQDLTELKIESREATVQGRMVVGLGNESVLETNISLHRTYGVPFIPGSALKGLTSSYAHQRLANWQEGSDAHRIMLGDMSNAGYVTFYDALPQTWELHQDVITVHHADYYSGKPVPPADWDDPNPISFISASGTFLLALSGPDEWVARAFEILGKALLEMGVGAKTSSGYGRLTIKP
jgi:CRISPR-associated protein Cmr6